MTKGAEGAVPDYYNVAQAARFWRVPPWELLQQSHYWITVADQLSLAEQHRDKMQNKRQATTKRRARRRGK